MSIRSNVDPRRLDQRITLQRATVDTNGDATGWTSLGTCYAAVDAAKASRSEPYDGSGIRSVGDYTIWIRYEVFQGLGLLLSDRVVWNGLALDIKDMPDQQRTARLMALICKTGLNQG